jgi:hypothetical protein
MPEIVEEKETKPEQSFKDWEKARSGDADPKPEAKLDSKPSEDAAKDEPKTVDESETSDEAQEKDEKDEEEAEKPVKKGGFQRRIDKLTKDKRELEDRLTRLESKLADKPADKAPEKPKEDGKPKAPRSADFDDWDKYEAARDKYQEDLTDWKLETRDKARIESDKATKAEDERKAIQAGWDSKVAKAKETFKDYDDVLEQAEESKVSVTPTMVAAMQDSDIGAHLGYHLMKNPDECARIAKLSAVSQVREIGKLEASIGLSLQKTPAKRISDAPEPPKRIGGAGRVPDLDLKDESVPFKEWERRRELARRS